MLWLAGILGLMAVGSVSVIDMGTNTDDDSVDDAAESGTDGPAQTSADTSLLQTLPDSDGNTEDLSAANGSTPDVTSIDENDHLIGTNDADTLFGDASNDILHGEDHDDIMDGDAGDDTLFGHNGNDTLHGGTGDDSLQGSDGDDIVNGDAGDDAVHGGLGDDIVSGGAGSDTLFGGHGDDVVNGMDDASASDFLNGGDGDDMIIAGNDDVVTSGNGADTIVGGSWITGGRAIDIVDFDVEDDNLLLIYEDGTDIPGVSLQPDPDDSEITQVLMDGVAVANVLNGAGVSINDIAIMPLSLAQSTGMAQL